MPNNLILAPLAGYTDLPFRLLCREYGAGLCVSEMISCHGLAYQQKKTISMLASCPEDRPLAYQLFGADPAIMAEATSILKTFKPDLIDINMGCPVKKVTKRGAGAALMTDLALAEKIIISVMDNSDCPVTVKMRSGPDFNNLNGLNLAKIAEQNGISAVIIHGRTWKQAFAGRADWDGIGRIKKELSIPVIGNGDITTYMDAMSKIRAGVCDAVMIGRAALGNPWVFHPGGRPQALEPVTVGALRHMTLLERFVESPHHKLAAMKNHLGKYFKGFSGSSSIRKNIYEASDWTTLKHMLTQLYQPVYRASNGK